MDKEFDPVREEDKENTAMDCVEPEEENISQSFICCVCLDLMYKPIVLACGHISCFWCVHKSMNSGGESSCPICRNPYHHFPTICQMLHFLIMKMYPNAYRRRENQTLEEEKRTGYFSPQFEGSSLKSKSNLSSEISKLETPECKYQLQDGNMAVTEESNQSQNNTNGSLNQISITDALCPACKKLLFRPAVLNCGHAYCETCITIPEDKILICQICEIPHPSEFPKVCLELGNFLEETFLKEYASRRDSIEHNRVGQQNSPSACSSSTKYGNKGACSSLFPSGDLISWLNEHGPKVHFGAGCDYCGILPIVGNRYQCKDCKEAIGFDLCGECYNTQSKLPGRFNQQHTADHKFMLIETSDVAHTQLLRYVRGTLEDRPIVLSSDVSEDSDDGTTPRDGSNNAQENADNNIEDSAESNNNSTGDQNNNTQPSP